jgi:hypothetical protein
MPTNNILPFIKHIEKYEKKNKIIYSVTKKYPEFSRVYLYHEGKSVFNNYKKSIGYRENITTPEQSLLDSLRRTKTTISDIAISNHFDMFATFTFNCDGCKFPCAQKICTISTPHTDCPTIKCNCPPDQCLRLDPEACKRRMHNWLNNQTRRKGKFQYLIVPEWHKKGGLHFHAMMKNYKGKLNNAHRHKTRANYIHKGSQVYNIDTYKNGFTTVKMIPSDTTTQAKVSNYIKKYIVKDMPQFKGRKRYWVSRDLIRPVTTIGDLLTNNPFVDQNHIKKVYSNGRMDVLRANIQNNLRNSPIAVMLNLPQPINHERMARWLIQKNCSIQLALTI